MKTKLRICISSAQLGLHRGDKRATAGDLCDPAPLRFHFRLERANSVDTTTGVKVRAVDQPCKRRKLDKSPVQNGL